MQPEQILMGKLLLKVDKGRFVYFPPCVRVNGLIKEPLVLFIVEEVVLMSEVHGIIVVGNGVIHTFAAINNRILAH